MYNEILDGVTRQLFELFGDEYEIYTDHVNQGVTKPCFFVQIFESSEKPMMGCRAFRVTGICIKFLQGDIEQPSVVRNQVSEILMPGMEFIRLSDDSLLRGTSRNFRTEDDTLNFFVNYNRFIYKSKQIEEPMETFEIKKVSCIL